MTHHNLTCAYAVPGEHHLAIKHLEICVKKQTACLAHAQEEPVLRGLRASGEFAAFLENLSRQGE